MLRKCSTYFISRFAINLVALTLEAVYSWMQALLNLFQFVVGRLLLKTTSNPEVWWNLRPDIYWVSDFRSQWINIFWKLFLGLFDVLLQSYARKLDFCKQRPQANANPYDKNPVPIRKVVRSGCLNCAPLCTLHQFVP
jgi:hypothetical protein